MRTTRTKELLGWAILVCLLIATPRTQCFSQQSGELFGGPPADLITPNWIAPPIVPETAVNELVIEGPELSVLRTMDTSFESPDETFVPDDMCQTSTCPPAISCCGTAECGSLCGPKCCGLWARFDVLGWALQGYSTPSLLTGSPIGTPQSAAGVLGNPGTTTLFGNRRFGDGLRLGGRLQMGYWFDPCRRIGVQGDFFSLGSSNDSGNFRSDGSNILARPFFNTNPAVNAPDAQLFAMPGLAEGSLNFNTSSRIVSAGPALRFNLSCCQEPCSNRSRRTDFLLGYRYFGVQEEFAAREVLRPTDGLFPAGTRYELNDRIRTENDFHGVEFGLNHMFQRGRWYWDVASVFAVGQVRRVAELDGSTRITVPEIMDTTVPGGFFVGSNDVGRYVDNDIAVLPQVRANLGFCIANNWRIGAGYNFMYLSSMFRPDSYLNTSFDGSQLGRPPTIGVVGERPATPRRSAYLHGVNVFLAYNF